MGETEKAVRKRVTGSWRNGGEMIDYKRTDG